MANNNAIYNAVIAGATGGFQQRWLSNSSSSSYASFKTMVQSIAVEVDALIAAATITQSQVDLMQSIAEGVLSGRFPQSTSQYAAVAQAIVALYDQLNTALLPVSGGGGTLVNLTDTMFVDVNTTVLPADQNGNIEAPFTTITEAANELADLATSTQKTIFVMPGDYSAEGVINWLASEDSIGTLVIANFTMKQQMQNGPSQEVVLPEINGNGFALIGCTFGDNVTSTSLLDLSNCTSSPGIDVTADTINGINCKLDSAGTVVTLTSSGSTFDNCQLGEIQIGSESTLNLKGTIVGGPIVATGDPGIINADDFSAQYMATVNAVITNARLCTQSSQLLWFGCAAGVFAADQYLRPFQPLSTVLANELTLASLSINRSGKIRNLRARMVGAGVATGDAVIVVRKNAVDQTLTATITDGSSSAEDLDYAHQISVANGDDVSIEMDPTTLDSVLWVSVEFFPTSTGS